MHVLLPPSRCIVAYELVAKPVTIDFGFKGPNGEALLSDYIGCVIQCVCVARNHAGVRVRPTGGAPVLAGPRPKSRRYDAQ